MVRHSRHWRGSAQIALTGAISITVGFGANILTGGKAGLSFETGVYLAIAGIAVGLLAGAKLLLARQDNSGDDSADEGAVIKRMRALLQTLEDRIILDPFTDIPMSVALREKDSSRDSRTEIETWSAFIANLATDPRCTIVTGAPGAGKSTLMKLLALEMLNSRDRARSDYIPILLQCYRWSPDQKFQSWLVKEASGRYGVPSRLATSWLHRGRAVFLLDGIDEVPRESWSLLRAQINSWLASPVGGRAVLSCRHDAYTQFFNVINHEQVASLQPLSEEAIGTLLDDLVAPSLRNEVRLDECRSLIRNVVFSAEPARSNWSTPLLIRVLASGIQDDEVVRRSSEAGRDSGAVAVMLGDTLSKQGDPRGAVTSYLVAANDPSSAWRALGGARASLLLAGTGDYEGARDALQLSLASELEASMHTSALTHGAELNDDDRAVLMALSEAVSRDAFQVSSVSSIPLARSNAALRRLRDRGLVDVVDADDGEPRFCRAPVEMVDQ